LRNVKYSLLIACLALLSVRCGESKKVPDAYASITKNKFVRIAVNPFTVPFETAAGTGVEGFDIDLGEEVAKDLNFPTKWIQWNSFEKVFELLKNGEVEIVISSVAITDELKKDFAFSEPYFDTSNTIARRKDNTEIKELTSLAGKKVGVQVARTAEAFMTKQTTAANVTVTKFLSIDEALGALNRGELDAVVGDKPILTFSIAKNYSTNIMTTDIDLGKYQFAVVVRPEETKLLASINQTINRLKSAGQLKAWNEKWFGSVLQEATADAKKAEEIERLKIAPKNLTVFLVKESGSTVRLDRLDGFNATLVGTGGSFNSTPIMTDDAGVRGNCKFGAAIPPGEYKFNLSRIGVSQTITVEKKPVTSYTVTLTFTRSGALVLDWK
jgi:arginine/lysine/histidine/glutamine transport system substrate-binding/permease protein